MNGKVIPVREALISPMESIHLAIFEGIKAYVEGDVMSSGDLNIFGWEQHIDRLWRSADVNGLVMQYSKNDLLEAIRACIIKNDYIKNTYAQPRIWPKGARALRATFWFQFGLSKRSSVRKTRNSVRHADSW